MDDLEAVQTKGSYSPVCGGCFNQLVTSQEVASVTSVCFIALVTTGICFFPLSYKQNYLQGSRPTRPLFLILRDSWNLRGGPKDPRAPISCLAFLCSDSLHLKLRFKLPHVIYPPCRLCMPIFQSRLPPPCQSTDLWVNRPHQPASMC